jgi:hypothetical protein
MGMLLAMSAVLVYFEAGHIAVTSQKRTCAPS